MGPGPLLPSQTCLNSKTKQGFSQKGRRASRSPKNGVFVVVLVFIFFCVFFPVKLNSTRVLLRRQSEPGSGHHYRFRTGFYTYP